MSKRYPWAKWTLPDVVDPPDRLCFTIPVPNNPLHLAAFRGALLSLASATKWQDDPGHTAKSVALVWQEIYDQVVACEPTALPESWDEDLTSLCEALRFQNGKLQALCCGAWVDITGQPAQGWAIGATGVGTTPPAAGACVDYQANISGNGYWYTPFVVSTGDTITVSLAKGATYNPANGGWYCPDGSLFFGGACLASTLTAGGNPMPAILSGKLIAKIGATFYDVYNGTFTVPAGIASQPVQFQFNYASIATSSGDVSFQVHYCNNGSMSFTHTFNFLLSNGSFAVTDVSPGPSGIWSPSVGWSTNAYILSGTNNICIVTIKRTFASTPITSMVGTYDLTKGNVSGASGINDFLKGDLSGANVQQTLVNSATNPDGTNKTISVLGMTGNTNAITFQVLSQFSVGAGTNGSGVIKQLVVTGSGADPF